MVDQELFDGEVRTTIDDDENLSFRRADPATPGSRVISWSNFKTLLRTLFVWLGDVNQSIDGIKTFLKSPEVPDPVSDLQAVNFRTLNQAAAGSENKQNVSTSIVFGGEISINAGDNTKIDIEAGQAIIVDSYSTPDSPVFIKITWLKQIGISLINISSQLLTFIIVRDDGTGNPEFIQASQAQNTSDSRDAVELGLAVHTDLATISSVSSFSNQIHDVDLKILDFGSAFGRINKNGNIYTANGANLQIDKTSGRMFGVNVNYGINKKDPNYINSDPENALTFITVYGDGGTQVGQSNTIDTNNYNPLGEGGLVPIPLQLWSTQGIFFSPETGITTVHYGQFLYDSAKNAIDSWRRESYNIVPELTGVALRGVIAFRSGATDLSDPDQAKFIDPGSLGLLTNENIQTYSRYGEPVELINSMSSFNIDIELIESGGVIYAEVERENVGGNIDFVFNQREYTLNCTTGPGTGGKARIALIPGPSSTDTQTNWLYAIKSNDEAILQVSTTRPLGEFSYIYVCEVPSVAAFITDGARLEQRYNDSKSWGGRSSVQRTNEWIRTRRPEYEDGLIQSVSVDTGTSPDSIDYTQTPGEAWQKHLQSIPALQVSIDGIRIANHPTTPGLQVFNLNSVELLQDSSGSSLSGESFNWVIWASVGYKNNTNLWINLPEAADDSPSAAISKQNNGDRSIPKKYKSVGILVASLPFSHSPSGGGSYVNLASALLGLQVIDLRGKLPDSTSGGSGTSVVNEFLDSLFRIISNLSSFTAQFILDKLTTNRQYTLQNKSGTIAHLDDTTLINSTFDTGTTDANPGADAWRFNNATQSASTFIYINEEGGVNAKVITSHVETLKNGASLNIQCVDNTNKFAVISLNSDPVNASTYIKLPISIENFGSSDFEAGDRVTFDLLNVAGNSYDFSFALSDESSDLTTDNDSQVDVIRAQKIESITFAVNVAPTGSDILVDVLKNGSTVLTGPITLPAASDSVTIIAPQIIDTILSVGDEIKADITQIGATTAGQGAKIYFKTTLS